MAAVAAGVSAMPLQLLLRCFGLLMLRSTYVLWQLMLDVVLVVAYHRQPAPNWIRVRLHLARVLGGHLVARRLGSMGTLMSLALLLDLQLLPVSLKLC